jgi:hypothetical protein
MNASKLNMTSQVDKCEICGSFKRPNELLRYGERGVPSNNFKHHELVYETLIESSLNCYCCKILFEGIAGCLEQEKKLAKDVSRIDLNFEYQTYEDHEDYALPDCQKEISIVFSDETKLEVELFTLEGMPGFAILENSSNCQKTKTHPVQTHGMMYTVLDLRQLPLVPMKPLEFCVTGLRSAKMTTKNAPRRMKSRLSCLRAW